MNIRFPWEMTPPVNYGENIVRGVDRAVQSWWNYSDAKNRADLTKMQIDAAQERQNTGFMQSLVSQGFGAVLQEQTEHLGFGVCRRHHHGRFRQWSDRLVPKAVDIGAPFD